ncbi:hypothetical protein R5R35_011373 [Gryllus longicercus]|uniref:FAM193 C-terminal domain-containing protein n=1 Tax=Gryllus longicercus TaxID=2509291 RepID=A0AAN9WAJ3_9ORTH
MSCSDTKKSKKRKNCKSGNMGDVLGKECGDSENDELQVESCEESVREEADGAPSVDEQCPQGSSEEGSGDTKIIVESKDGVSQKKLEVPVVPVKEEKPCNCDACKDRRELAAEQMEEMRRLQSYWLELRQYIRMVYRMAMEGSEVDATEENIVKMKELVQKLCVRDPHQLFQRLESQVQEFVIEAKVRQLELLHREEQTPEVAQIFLRGLLEGFEKLCRGAKQLTPLLQQLEAEHLQRFNLTWEVLNKHLYQSCVYTDPLVQNNLPLYIGKLRSVLPGESDVYTELVHRYLVFDDEMTLIGAMWRDTETRIHEYNQEQATLKAKQRMLREDWEFFKAQRKLIHQKMWSKATSELREFDEQLVSLATLAGSPESPPDGQAPEEGCSASAIHAAAVSTALGPSCSAGLNVGPSFCLGCSTRRSCPCDDCAMSHLLTCGALITPACDGSVSALQNSSLYGHKTDSTQEFRAEGEGSEQPPESPTEPGNTGETNDSIEGDIVELSNTQQQSCECHVCTAPLMSAMDLMESYECHTCVQQAMPPPGNVSSPGVNVNLHTSGFHLYPHIHGTGGGGDAGSLYPHLYNVHPSLLSQLGTKHSRLGVHLQDQVPLTSIDPKTQHMVPPSLSSVADLLPPGLSLEALPPLTNSGLSVASGDSSTIVHPALNSARVKTIANAIALSSSAPPEAVVPVSTSAATTPVPSVKSSGNGSPVQQQKVKVNSTCQDPGNIVANKPLVAEKHSQNSTSTQTSPNKALAQQKLPPTSTTASKPPPQSVVKRVPAGGQQLVNGHHHPVSSSRASNVSSVRHSMTQTASSGNTHSHVNSSLPDVVRSAASSTTSHRSVPGSAGKVIGHSCHKTLKNGGNVEPIKRVSCTDFADGEVVDAEDSSSQDDTCSERSSSTTTSTQRDSRHCDCCYCEVFGHGVPSVAPVSRNYQEMRERLRLLLTKKKAKCKMGANSSTGATSNNSNSNTVSQPVTNNASNSMPETAAKPVSSTTASSAASVASVPSQSSPLIPLLSMQNSPDSLSQPSKDPRDLEALLDFIEGNQSGRCKNLKKAAKKARQKQRKLEEKERKEQEEAERLRGLAALQSNAPEVTITVVNTPGGKSDTVVAPSQNGNQSSNSGGRNGKGSKVAENQGVQLPATNGTDSNTPNKATTAPQMVTIKRVMEPNGAEPTVTITLKGATPDKDKVLFTLVNGQVCQSQDDSKSSNQSNAENVKTNPSNTSGNGKKKKNKGNGGNNNNNNNNNSNNNNNNNSGQTNSNSSKNKSQQNTAKNNSKSSGNPSSGKSSNGKQSQPGTMNSSAGVEGTANFVPPVSQLAGPTANTQLNDIATSKGSASVVALRSKIEASANNSRSFSLENLKLPPGITITKVDGPAAAAAAQRRAQLKAQDNPKPPTPATSASTTTIIAAPTSMGNPARIAGFGQAVNGSNVIVVDTGRMKDDLEGNVMTAKDAGDASQNVNGNGKKKKKKNKNNGNNENENNITCTNSAKQNQQLPGKQNMTNGKNQNQRNSSNSSKSQSNLLQLQGKQNGNSKNNNALSQPAIIKVNGSMVTIRNSALQQAMSSAGPRLSQHVNGQADVQINGDVEKNVTKGNKRGSSNAVVNSAANIKGKENNAVRFTNSDSSARSRGGQGECNGVTSNIHGKMGSSGPRMEDNGINVRGGNVNNTSQRTHPLQQQIPPLNQKVMQNHAQEANIQHSNSRAMMQAQSAVREAMAAATEAKKKKKKKKGAGGQGHSDDWNLVESVFAPKDIDLENGDIDDDERELEAFKRFCFNSVPPKRKEKVHLNIKDIVLKKKSSAIGCS